MRTHEVLTRRQALVGMGTVAGAGLLSSCGGSSGQAPVAEPAGVWFGLLAGLATTAALLLTRFVRVLRYRTVAQPSGVA